MRKASASDFLIQLPGVGNFIFGRRTFKDHAAIRADFVRLTQGQEDDELASYAFLIAAMNHLCVAAPKGWEDLENAAMDDAMIDKAFELLGLLNAAEKSFRQGAIQGSEAPRQGAIEQPELLVSEEVQPAAE